MHKLATFQDGAEHASPILLGDDEAREHLAAERQMHALAGWRIEDADTSDSVITAGFNAIKDRTIRAVYIFEVHPTRRERMRSWWLRRGL